MASKFGFNKVAIAVKAKMTAALREMAEASKDEFVGNFDRQSFDGVPWMPLKARTEPPPKLDVTGALKANTANSIKVVTSKRAILENETIDSRGRSYAAYHNDGTSMMVARPIMKHTDKLTDKHLKILYRITGEAWRRAY